MGGFLGTYKLANELKSGRKPEQNRIVQKKFKRWSKFSSQK